MDLSRFGIPADFMLRGTVQSHRLDGSRLFFLFGERHTVKACIRANLLNALDLCKLGRLSCVGVEGWVDPSAPVPCEDVKRLYAEEKATSSDVGVIIDGILKGYRRRNFLFWNIIAILQPSLPIESVEDQELFQQVASLEPQYYAMRKDAVAYFLKKHSLFLPTDDLERERYIDAKSMAQTEQEFAEHGLNLQRDDTFIKKMLSLWDRAGTDKAAILNAGASHQYRIARQLRSDAAYRDVSYVHIEQP